MANQTFTPGIGRLALDRYDFQNHVDGYSFQHNATAIAVSPSIVFDGAPRTNVYSSLSAISLELADLALSGKGFLLVGDGYDTYINSLLTPDNPYDPSVPAFDTYLNDVLNNPANPFYFRIRSGGIVVIKAGTYKFTGPVNVPPGIILMGEGYGTKIVNQGAGPSPMFVIKADTSRIPDSGVDSTETFIFCKETMFINLTIADNFPEPKFLGDLTYKNPINSVSALPLINPLVSLEEGASLSCENVRFVGKTTYNLGVISNVTAIAIATNSNVPVSTGTRLKVLNSSIDGFSIPIIFTASGKHNDNFIMTNTLMRGYGYFQQDLFGAANNTLIRFNAGNTTISNNYLFGNSDNVSSLIRITPISPNPLRQSRAKIIISDNEVAVARSSNTVNTTFDFVKSNGSIDEDNTVLSIFGNIFDNNPYVSLTPNTNDNLEVYAPGSITIDGDTNISIQGSSGISNTTAQFDVTATLSNILSSLVLFTRDISSDHTVNALDYILFVDTTNNPISITLPIATQGRQLIIKDVGFNASVNNITLIYPGGAGFIENVQGSRIIATNGASWTLTANSSGNRWFII